MSGVALGQVFSEDELDRILNWYAHASDHPSVRLDEENFKLLDKIHAYRTGIVCAC